MKRLSFITPFKIEILLPFTGCRKMLGKMPVMMMNCFSGTVDWRKVFSLISSRDHCLRLSPSRISNTPRTGFETARNLNPGLVERSCVVAITTTPWDKWSLLFNKFSTFNTSIESFQTIYQTNTLSTNISQKVSFFCIICIIFLISHWVYL